MDILHLFAQSADTIKMPVATPVLGDTVTRSDRAVGYLFDATPLDAVIGRAHSYLSLYTHELLS